MKLKNEQAVLALIENWKKDETILLDGMLRTALRPIISAEVDLFQESRVRIEDVENLAWFVVRNTLRAATLSSQDLLSCVQETLKNAMPNLVKELQAKMSSLRTATPSPTKA